MVNFVIFFYFIFITIILIISKNKKERRKEIRRSYNANTLSSPVNIKSSDIVKLNTSSASAKIEPALRDDRSNDWLAKQLRDEAKAATYVKEMFNLKYDHYKSCDAETIKRFHEDNCDASGIDTAISK